MEGGNRMNWTNNITGLQHIGIPTNDIEVTKTFYQKIGFEVVYETVIEKTGEKVAFLKLKDIVIETYENKEAVMKDGAINHIALNVLDIQEVFTYALDNHFELLDEEIQFLPFWDNGVNYFTIKGPNEERVEFNQYL